MNIAIEMIFVGGKGGRRRAGRREEEKGVEVSKMDNAVCLSTASMDTSRGTLQDVQMLTLCVNECGQVEETI